MLNSLKQKQYSSVIFKHFVLMNLIFPLYSSRYESVYSPDIVYANIFAVLFIALVCLEGNIDWKRRSLLGYAVGVLLVCFNFYAFRAAYNNDGWYWGMVHVTVAFLFFLAWLFLKDGASCADDDTVRFVLKSSAITNAIGLIPGILGFCMVAVSIHGYSFVPKNRFDPTYSWIFMHKSEYSFMLVLFLALTVTYRRLYTKNWQFWGTIAVYTAGLVIANTRATLLAALFIPAGVLLDSLVKKAGGFKLRSLLYFIPFIAFGIVMLYFFSRERDVLSLGHRTYIWQAAIRHIRDVPDGVGAMCGLQTFPVESIAFEVRNCHNVFLNYFLQFSVPAGYCFLFMILSIVAASIKRNLSFQTLGIWVALLIPLNMDWCIMLGQVPVMLLVLYLLFFRKTPAPHV